MIGYYIDEHGKLWPESSPQFSVLIGTARRIDEVRDVLERTMGYIYVRRLRSGMLVRLDATSTAEPSLIGLLYFICENNCENVIFSASDTPWSHNLVRGRDNLIKFIQSKIDARRIAVMTSAERLKSREQSLEGKMLALALAAQAIIRELPSDEVMATVANPLFKGRFTLAEQRRDNGQVIVREMGEGYRQFDPEWFKTVIGRSMSEYPDAEYGHWVSGAYCRALQLQKPQLEDIDAFVQWPQSYVVRSRYKRLLVPVEKGDGRRLLLAATMAAPDVDLR